MNRNSFHLIAYLVAVSATLGMAVPQAQSETAVPPGLTRAEPIVCASSSELVVRGRFIETAGNGITVQGNCDIAIVDSHIVAGGVGVLVQGNGDAMISNSYVEGGQAALVASGNGNIYYSATTLRGVTRTGGHGEIAGDDGAVHGSGGMAGILGELRIGLPGIEVGSGDDTVSIGPGGVRVRSGDDTVTVAAGGIVVDDGIETVSVQAGAEGLRIETGGVTLILDADVTIDGDFLRLGLGAGIEISGGWRAADSPYRTSDTDRLLFELGATDDSGQLHIGLAGDVLFDVDSAAIRPPGAAELRKVAHVLRDRAVGEVQFVGHTDSLGSDEHNHKLSQARSVAVMRWLNSEENIPVQLMVGQGMGAEKPIAYNTLPDGSDNPTGRAKNRRVEIFIGTQR